MFLISVEWAGFCAYVADKYFIDFLVTSACIQKGDVTVLCSARPLLHLSAWRTFEGSI